ncbi:MAG: IS4 family transposase [Acidobacteriota bacterium]
MEHNEDTYGSMGRRSLFNDRRLDRRFFQLVEKVAEGESVNISKISSGRSQQISFYRLLGNDKLSEAKIIRTIEESCQGKVEEGVHYILPSDSSDMNLENHLGRLKVSETSAIGPINDFHTGFFLHPVLVMEARTERCIGFSSVYIWSREPMQKNKKERKYKSLPIEEKESYKWIKTAEESKNILKKASMVTIVEDREGDIFEEWARIPDSKTHLLVRASQNRVTEGGMLYEYLSSQPVISTMQVELRGDIRKEKTKRLASLEVRAAEVVIKRPEKFPEESPYPKSLRLRAIEVKEVTSSVPKGEKPILWRLLTTHTLESLEKIMDVIKWYSKRWYIEQLFRLMKKEGLKIEESELETPEAIRRLALISLTSALKVMMLLLASKNDTSQRLEDEFTAEEAECLDVLCKEYEGNTEKQKNPYERHSLRWASWIIARIGGWKGYQSQHKPGPITFITGLEKFNSLMLGWELAKNRYQFVYTP